MRIKLALIAVAALALSVPSAALTHKGDRGHGPVKHQLRDHAKKHVRHALDHRLNRWWRAHYDRKRHHTFELGAEELMLTGTGKLGSRTVQQPEGQSSSFRA